MKAKPSGLLLFFGLVGLALLLAILGLSLDPQLRDWTSRPPIETVIAWIVGIWLVLIVAPYAKSLLSKLVKSNKR